MMEGPGYWMNESTGVLAPAVRAYFDGVEMTGAQVWAIRAYFRQWMEKGNWQGPQAEALRDMVSDIRDRRDIDNWLRLAEQAEIDPL